MNRFLPEGCLSRRQENKAAVSTVSALREACARETVLEARATKCDREHNLRVELGPMEGVIPRSEGALGIEDGSVRDIALISRVGKPVCFVVTGSAETTPENIMPFCPEEGRRKSAETNI